jgi:hypothetical protein
LYAESKEVKKFGDWLSKTYGVTVATHRGKVHNSLEMIFISEKGKVMINMIKYIKTSLPIFWKKLW